MADERWKREGATGRKLKRAMQRPSAGSVTKHRDDTQAMRRGAQRVRIIGGRWKRTPLPVINTGGLRPTPDRVRETLFNWLEHLLPSVELARGVDLFAGTGALGFELASRGAESVTLIENNRELAEQLERTKQKLAATQIDIVAGDALSVVARWPDASFDVVFIDPPFDSSLLPPALTAASRLIAPTGLVYVESGVPIEAMLDKHSLHTVRSGRAGRVHFHLLQHRSA